LLPPEPTASEPVGFPLIYWRRLASRVPLGVEFDRRSETFVSATAASGAKRPFASTQHFVTDKQLAKSYTVLSWSTEEALFNTLAGIEQPHEYCNNIGAQRTKP